MLQATGKAVSRMDKCEIIERLKNIAEHAVYTVGEEPFVMSLDDGIAVHEAIELLKKPETNCSEIPNSSDTISRQQAINKIKPWLEVKGYGWGELNMLRAVINELENMPSVQPEQRWIPVTEESVIQAGYEGKEVRFRIRGRLFAIRELAQ